jgi:hypothetical protein
MEKALELLGIYFLCGFKFIAGPTLGPVAGFNLITTCLVTISGMMTSVTIFALAGQKVKTYWESKMAKPKPKFSHKNRRVVAIWRKYGEIGIAFFTPLFLTPIGGTLIMVSFGVKKRRILGLMLLSAIFWAIVLSLSIETILQIPFFENLFP